jgi:aminoglycoside phosphotransferase (APT) family kinase protein
MPDSDRLCHGDFHFANIMGEPGNASIVDWPSAKRGHPAADVCQSWLLMQRPPGDRRHDLCQGLCQRKRFNAKGHSRLAAIVAGARCARR